MVKYRKYFKYNKKMDFKSFKKGAVNLKNKLIKQVNKGVDFSSKKINETIDSSAKRLKESSIKTNEELLKFIDKSKETSFKNKETGEEKKFKHKVVVIFGEEKTDFFKKYLLRLPILNTKGFASGIKFKLATSKIKGVNLKSKYKVEEIPSMVVFQDKKVYKIIPSEKNIEKITKSFKINIEEDLENFKTN